MVDDRLKGVFPPITTPFVNEELRYDKLTENVERFNKTAIKGYVVLGSNGEFPYLTFEEKAKVIETVSEAAKPAGKTVIAGVSCESAKESAELAVKAGEAGADYAIAVTPHYYKSKMTHEALVSYYTCLAERSPLPVLIYNMPAFTGISVQPKTIRELSKHPNIAGMKDSAGVFALTGAYISESDAAFGVLAGSASFLYPGLVEGCCGGVLALACAFPGICCQLYQLTLDGKHEEARALQLRLIAPNTAITSTYGIAGLKHAMELAGWFGGDVRVPLQPLRDEDREDIEHIMREAQLL